MKTVGRPAPSSDAPIYVYAPHIGLVDPTVMLFPDIVSPLLAANLGNAIPISILDAIFVNRSKATAAQDVKNKMIKRAKESENGKAWRAIGLFVSGCCSNRTALINFRVGAFSPGVNVQPVFVDTGNLADVASWCWFEGKRDVVTWKCVVALWDGFLGKF